MKTTLFTVLLFIGSFVQAAQIQNARLNLEKEVIELDVVYSGGCNEHEFALQVKTCTRATPTDCVATLLEDDKGDTCRGIVSKTVEIPATEFIQQKSLAMDRLVILGENNSEVVVELF